MAKKFVETRTTTVIYFKHIHTNPRVENENKQSKNAGVTYLTKVWKCSTSRKPASSIFLLEQFFNGALFNWIYLG
jgi:hypothetical protein